MSHAPSIPIQRDRPPIALAAGLAVSVLVHVGAAWWLGVMPERPPTDRFTLPPATMLPEPDEPQQPQLGMDIPENASIAWLGVLVDPIEGVAPESEIDQAALTPTQGETDPVEPTPPEQTDPIEPEEPVEPEEPIEPEPEPEPAPQPGDPIILPTDPSEPDLPEQPVTEPVDPREMGPPLPPDDWREQQQESDPSEPAERTAEQAAEPAEPPPPTPQRPPTEGTPGELDPRAADAAMRRRAQELDISRLGRPLQASGDLRLNTVRPRWSLQVRNAYSPRRNPFMEIRFGADGRVKLARFVPLPDGTRGSGYSEVDQPLLNAVYGWTAEGKAIEALDPNDPDATHDIVMRFLLVPSARGDRDDE